MDPLVVFTVPETLNQLEKEIKNVRMSDCSLTTCPNLFYSKEMPAIKDAVTTVWKGHCMQNGFVVLGFCSAVSGLAVLTIGGATVWEKKVESNVYYPIFENGAYLPMYALQYHEVIMTLNDQIVTGDDDTIITYLLATVYSDKVRNQMRSTHYLIDDKKIIKDGMFGCY
jgi:hypothetical protein